MAAARATKDFQASAEELPASDPRDAAVKRLDAMCREIIELAHEIQSVERDLNAARNGGDMDALVASATKFGMLRERIFAQKESIEAAHRHYVVDEGMNIFLSHTDAGLPIRVHKNCKKELWH